MSRFLGKDIKVKGPKADHWSSVRGTGKKNY